MEDLYQKLDDILKFFTTDNLTGLPRQIGKFMCIPLMSPEMEHAGYVVAKGKEMHFFPAQSIKELAPDNEESAVQNEIYIDELWSSFHLN